MLHYQPRGDKPQLARTREPFAITKRVACFECDQTTRCTQHRGAWLCEKHAPAKPMDKVK